MRADGGVGHAHACACACHVACSKCHVPRVTCMCTACAVPCCVVCPIPRAARTDADSRRGPLRRLLVLCGDGRGGRVHDGLAHLLELLHVDAHLGQHALGLVEVTHGARPGQG